MGVYERYRSRFFMELLEIAGGFVHEITMPVSVPSAEIAEIIGRFDWADKSANDEISRRTETEKAVRRKFPLENILYNGTNLLV